MAHDQLRPLDGAAPRRASLTAMKIATVVGARPQFIKAAVVSRAIEAWNRSGRGASVQEILVHTGQHSDDNMSEVFFRELRIPRPAHCLGISGGTHGAMTGRMLESLEQVLLAEKPDAVLVYGDTNSTLAGALAAVKLHIPVGHVEAGLRSRNLRMPEEVNRVLSDRISHWLFCPTATAVDNLRREGLYGASILLSGDVMYDAALFYAKIAKPTPLVRRLIDEVGEGFCLCTVHRAENTDDPKRLAAIIAAVDDIARESPVVLPLHPRTRKQLERLAIRVAHVKLMEPVSYFDILTLLKNCGEVLTDSGGLQKEAFFFAKPCITLRDETEWVELVQLGANMLAGADRDAIVAQWKYLRQHHPEYSARPYGNGDAGSQIVASLASARSGG